MSTEPNVTYSVKEMLAKLEGKVDSVLIAVSQKVDRAEFDSLTGRVTKIELRGAKENGGREWFWRAVAAIPGLAALAAFLHHG
jgi:hypothetical protein